MLKIAVCDDEVLAVTSLSSDVATYFDSKDMAHHITAFYDGESLLRQSTFYDLIFLDIQMGKINGMETARAIKKDFPDTAIIFITALKEYVFEAFDVRAVHYLIKPVQKEKLYHVLDSLFLKKPEEKYLVIRDGRQVEKVEQNRILYCEVYGHKIMIHTFLGVTTFHGRIGDVEKELGDAFFRCHKSYLIHLAYVNRYADGMIQMKNGDRIPVAIRRKKEFLSHLLHFQKGEIQSEIF